MLLSVYTYRQMGGLENLRATIVPPDASAPLPQVTVERVGHLDLLQGGT